MNIMYTLCTSEESIKDALAVLARSELLILDCEGRELGKLGGALSLFTIGTAHAEHIFVFDAVALDRQTSAMTEIMRLLARPDVCKVVWDGRMDFLELRATYGVHLGGVLDLQLAEVASRAWPRKEDEAARLRRLIASFGYREVNRGGTRFAGIHVLMGLDRCLLECNMADVRGKDQDVTTMHNSGGSAVWMERPLSEQLLCYAANDVRVIALLYDHFQEADWLSAKVQPDLLEQSARYVAMHSSKERVDRTDMFLCHPFLPFDILTERQNSAKRCRACKRMVSQVHFGGAKGQRSSHCRMCQAVVLRKKVQEERDLKKANAAALSRQTK